MKHQDIFDLLKKQQDTSKHLICTITLFHGYYPMCRSRGGTGGPDPPPLENYKNIGFLSNTSPDPLKITKLPINHSMLGHLRPASECHLNGVSLAGR